jgi:hypothetical protein
MGYPSEHTDREFAEAVNELKAARAENETLKSHLSAYAVIVNKFCPECGAKL